MKISMHDNRVSQTISASLINALTILVVSASATFAEDIDDNNLPRMYWFALEPMVPDHPREALKLAVGGKIPFLQESVARRLTTGDAPVNEQIKGVRPL